MLVHRLRRCSDLDTPLGECLVLAEMWRYPVSSGILLVSILGRQGHCSECREGYHKNTSTFTQCCFNVGPAYPTSAQYCVSASCLFWSGCAWVWALVTVTCHANTIELIQCGSECGPPSETLAQLYSNIGTTPPGLSCPTRTGPTVCSARQIAHRTILVTSRQQQYTHVCALTLSYTEDIGVNNFITFRVELNWCRIAFYNHIWTRTAMQ